MVTKKGEHMWTGLVMFVQNRGGLYFNYNNTNFHNLFSLGIPVQIDKGCLHTIQKGSHRAFEARVESE